MIGQWYFRGPQFSRIFFLMFDAHLIGKQSFSWCHCFLGILIMLLEREEGLELSCPFKSILFYSTEFHKATKVEYKTLCPVHQSASKDNSQKAVEF